MKIHVIVPFKKIIRFFEFEKILFKNFKTSEIFSKKMFSSKF